MRTMITDSMWTLLEPRLKPTGLHACGAKPRLPDRQFLEALLYLARIALVMVFAPGFLTPRIVIHMWLASSITPTPRGCNSFIIKSAICSVMRS